MPVIPEKLHREDNETDHGAIAPDPLMVSQLHASLL